MADTKVFSFPDNGNNGGGMNANDLWPLLLMSGGGFGGGFGGMSPLWLIFMYPFLSQFFNGFGGFGGFGGNNAGAGFLANQLNNDNGRELIMQAVQGNNNAISQLAALLNTTHDQIQEGICGLNTSIVSLGNNVNMTGMQIINALQSGNTAVMQQICNSINSVQSTIQQGQAASQLQNCQSVNALQQSINNVQQSIANKDASDKLALCQQTYNLTDTANANARAIIGKLDAMETRALQDKLDLAREKNTQLQGEISQLNQNQYIAGVVGQSIAPINAQLAGLNKEVDDIKCKLPNTVSVQYPNLVAVNATPYVSGGIYPNGVYGNGYGYGYGGFGGF